MAERVVLDTNVLYPVHLRKALLEISKPPSAAEGEPSVEDRLFLPLWSADILVELRRNLLANGHSEPAVAAAIRRMQGDHPGAEVRGYQHLTESMTCDPGDRHVLAAAVHANAAKIVTRNVRDFPQHSVEPYGISVTHPDEFLQNLFDFFDYRITSVLRQQASENKPGQPRTLAELADALEKAGVPQFAALFRETVSSEIVSRFDSDDSI